MNKSKMSKAKHIIDMLDEEKKDQVTINYKGYVIVRSKYILGNIEIWQDNDQVGSASSIPAAKAKVDELISIFGS